jgi:hypothetical protein
MSLNALDLPYFKSTLKRYEQGDILRDITLIEWADVSGEKEVEITERKLQYCILLSQDCDLDHDYRNRENLNSDTKDKYLQSLLLCPAYPAESFRSGDHLASFHMKMQKLNSDQWKRLKQNGIARYHYLEKALDLQVPELVVDFKHYLTVPRDVLYRSEFVDSYVATVEIVYRDNLSARFAHYLSRIGLPELSPS